MFTTKIEVRFNDFDPMGHVNNAVFLTYLEIARVKYIDKLLQIEKLDVRDYQFILAHVSIDYKKPIEARYISADIWVSKIGNSSFEFAYRLYNEDNKENYAEATSIQVSYDYKQKLKVKIPQELRTILERENTNPKSN